MPGFQPIQRLATKVEKKNKIVEDSFDQSKHLLGVTSLKSITRPNFSGIGSVISPSSYHEQQDNDSNQSREYYPIIKPSVHFEQLGDHIQSPREEKTQKTNDNKSQRSFKTHDSKTIVTVATQIQFLDQEPVKPGAEITISPVQQVNPKVDPPIVPDNKSEITVKSSKAETHTNISLDSKNIQLSKKETDAKKLFAARQNIANKSVILNRKQNSFASTIADRDILSDKDEKKSEASSVMGDKGLLKGIAGGLISINEEAQPEQPQIMIATLGELSPPAQSMPVTFDEEQSKPESDYFK